MAWIAVSRADAGRPGKPETAPMKSKNGLKIEGVARSGAKGPIEAAGSFVREAGNLSLGFSERRSVVDLRIAEGLLCRF